MTGGQGSQGAELAGQGTKEEGATEERELWRSSEVSLESLIGY